jgi:His-Xaa-Ser system protein HxsD
VCIVHPGPGEDELDRLIADFRNEVLDYTLRERIREETRDVRTVILALAFTDTQLVEPT